MTPCNSELVAILSAHTNLQLTFALSEKTCVCLAAEDKQDSRVACGYMCACVHVFLMTFSEFLFSLIKWNASFKTTDTPLRKTLLSSYTCCVLSCSVVCDSLWPDGLQPTRLLCPWGFSRQEYWSGLPCPPPGDLSNLAIKPDFPHCRRILYHQSHFHINLEWVLLMFYKKKLLILFRNTLNQ